MDPDAAVDLINDAASEKDWGTVDGTLYGLAEWIDRGGFFPSRKIDLGLDGRRQLGIYYQNRTDAMNASKIIDSINKRVKAKPNPPAPAPEPAPTRGRGGRKKKTKDGELSAAERKRILRKIARI